MKKLLTTTLLLAAGLTQAWAQLTIDRCRAAARANYPAIRQMRLIEQGKGLDISNAAKAYLPQLSVTGNAAAFTDVADMPAQGLDIDNQIYNIGVTISQRIYDGGETSLTKSIAKAQANVESRQLEVRLYDVNQRVNQLFFGIITLDRRIEQNLLLQHDLDISLNTITTMMRGGVANQSDADAVKAETMKARQQETALRASRKAYVKMLALLTGLDINATTPFVLPHPTADCTGGEQCLRPEIKLFGSQCDLLNIQEKQLDCRLLPRLSAFGMAAYHNKVMPVMNNGMLAAGLTLSWNIGALYTRANDKRHISLQRQTIDSNRQAFVLDNSIKQQNATGNINALKEQIEMDNEIIALRESIAEKSRKKMQGGTETVNEMLRNINAVSLARQEKAIREVMLVKEIYELNNLKGNE